MKKAIISVWLMLLCGAAQAEWVKYGDGAKGGAIYYDSQRITTLPDGNVGVWEKSHWGPDEKTEDYSHTFRRYVYDCKFQRAAVSSIHHYSTDGSLLTSYTYQPKEWEFMDAVPGTAGDALMKLVCK